MNWSITKLKCYAELNGLVDVVYRAWWSCVGEDGEYSAEACSSCDLPAPSADFVPYTNLTEAQVLSWIWANGVAKGETEALVADMIKAKKNPSVVTLPLPWA